VGHCRRHGWIPCVYQAAEESLSAYRLGLRSLKTAEEAIVDLGSFSLAGGKRAALRSMVHKVARMGLVVRRYERVREAEPPIDEQLEEISEEWLAGKRLGELGFSLGRFSRESLDRAFVFLCLDGERVVAFTTWRPYRGGQAALLDLMRKRKDAPSGTMDLLVARSLEELRAAGLVEASLANAPLANAGEPRGGLEKGVALLFESLNSFYGSRASSSSRRSSPRAGRGGISRIRAGRISRGWPTRWPASTGRGAWGAWCSADEAGPARPLRPHVDRTARGRSP
jgi:lysylphosphatidylglycerol synthetase-like protein (DUF2156 family)